MLIGLGPRIPHADIVSWDVEAHDLSPIFHIRLLDRFGLTLVISDDRTFRRAGLSEFASSQNAENFFIRSITRDIEVI